MGFCLFWFGVVGLVLLEERVFVWSFVLKSLTATALPTYTEKATHFKGWFHPVLPPKWSQVSLNVLLIE